MHKAVERLAQAFALLGGVVLTALVLIVCLSILGRSLAGILHGDWVMSVMPGLAQGLLDLGVGPVNGDFELVEAGMAFTICAFLPLCQLHGAHASVDIFTSTLTDRVNRALRAVTEAIFAAVLIVIAWQLMQGMVSKYSSGQTTFLIQFPVWWAYAASLSGASVAALVAVYVAALRCIEAATGRVLISAQEAQH